MEYLELVISILSGIAVCIPLVIKLVSTVKEVVKEKNWNELVSMAFDYMGQAEELFDTGAQRKEWVMAMIKTSAETINYTLDEVALAKISKMIDDTCTLAKELVKPKKISSDTKVAVEETK